MLSRRLQILLDPERYERLSSESGRRGASVGELVRRAIDREYPPREHGLTPAGAAQSLLASEPPTGPEPDWEEQKERLLDELHGGPAAR